MEPNFEREPIAMAASSVPVDDSVKGRILERIKDQMAQESVDASPGQIPPIYLKVIDGWPS